MFVLEYQTSFTMITPPPPPIEVVVNENSWIDMGNGTIVDAWRESFDLGDSCDEVIDRDVRYIRASCVKNLIN